MSLNLSFARATWRNGDIYTAPGVLPTLILTNLGFGCFGTTNKRLISSWEAVVKLKSLANLLSRSSSKCPTGDWVQAAAVEQNRLICFEGQTMENESEFRTFKRRWYILAVFSSLGLSQNWIYSTYGPISGAVQGAYPSWTSSTVAMTANAGTISYLAFTWPCVWLLHKLGTRRSTLLITAAATVASVLRSLAFTAERFTASTFLCLTINGLVGVLVSAGAPLISALWFPEHERVTATCINMV